MTLLSDRIRTNIFILEVFLEQPVISQNALAIIYSKSIAVPFKIFLQLKCIPYFQVFTFGMTQ